MSSSANAIRARFGAADAERATIGLKRLPLVVRSAASAPAIASSTAAQSSAVRAIGPSLSSVHERAIAPLRETRPYVGRRPVTPQYADGVPIEPDVSEPIANGTRPAPTAEPEPLDDPPDQCSVLDRKSTRLNSSHYQISYAVFCLKKKKNNRDIAHDRQ